MHDLETLRNWYLVFVWIAAVSVTSFPVLYMFSPWRSTALGKILMLQAVSFAIAVDFTLLSSYGYPKSIYAAYWTAFIIFGLIAISTLSLTFFLWRTNHRSFNKEKK